MAAITPVIVTNRTSGVAPLAVFFDGTATTGLAESDYFKAQGYPNTNDYVNANFFWNFDSTGADTSGTRQLSKGFVSAHVFEKPGTYVVTMSVTDALGVSGSTSTTITVSAFTGTTYYCAANGNDNNPGTISQPFQTFSKLMSCAGTNSRLLFRNGDTFSFAPTYTATCDGPVIVSGYSDPNQPSTTRPILTWSSTTGSKVISQGGHGDWRWTDIHLYGTGTTRRSDNGGITLGGTNNLVLRVRQERIGSDTFMLNNANGAFIVDCDLHNFGAYGVFSDDSRQIAMIGNSFTDSHSFEHVMRIAGGDRTFIGYNYMTTADSKTAVQIRGSQFNSTNTNSVILDNECDGIIGVQPTKAEADQFLESHLIEGNYAHHESYSNDEALLTEAGHNIVFRNNICQNFQRPYTVSTHQTSGSASYVYFYNNTSIITNTTASKMVSGDAVNHVVVKNNLQYTDATSWSSPLAMVSMTVTGTNLISDNNLFYAPGYQPTWTIYNINSSWKTLAQAQAAGYDTHSVTGSPNLLSLDPASPDFCRFPSTSIACDTGAVVPVASDFDSYDRPQRNGYDIGATEWTPSAMALVDDTFLGSGTSAAASGYYDAVDSGTELSVVNPGINSESLYSLFTSNNTTGSGPVKSFPNQTLTNVGDKLVFSFKLRAENDWAASNASDYLRFGLLDYTGTVSGNLQSNGANYSGAYFGAIATGTGANGIWKAAQTINATSVFYNATAPNYINKLATDTTITTLGNTNDITTYAMSITIERVATGVKITLTKDGNSVYVTDTSSPFYSFDALAIVVPRNGSGNDFFLDDVEVVFWSGL